MIVSVEEMRKRINCDTMDDKVVEANLDAIEAVIRAYTNNNFQNRHVRFEAASAEPDYFHGTSPYLKVGDTVQISQSHVNDGLCVVTEVADEYVRVNKDLHQFHKNLVTKVEYPADVVQCAVDLFKWKQNMGDKVGLKSETISRHSVTFEDSATLFMGYPVGILNGLNLHKKARC